MNNLRTKYKVNDQGMIVEEIDELEVSESKEKINPQYGGENAILENVEPYSL